MYNAPTQAKRRQNECAFSACLVLTKLYEPVEGKGGEEGG